MEGSVRVSSDVADLVSATSASADVRRRWLLLGAALLVPLAAAFAIGAAVKSTPAHAPGTSLAPSLSVTGQRAAITALTGSAAVPGLKAPPKLPKPHQTAASTSSGSGGTPSTSTPSTVNSVPAVTTQTPPPVTTSPPPATTVTAPPPTQTGGGGGGTGGVAHGGG